MLSLEVGLDTYLPAEYYYVSFISGLSLLIFLPHSIVEIIDFFLR